MDKEAWQATVHAVTKSQTWLRTGVHARMHRHTCKHTHTHTLGSLRTYGKTSWPRSFTTEPNVMPKHTSRTQTVTQPPPLIPETRHRHLHDSWSQRTKHSAILLARKFTTVTSTHSLHFSKSGARELVLWKPDHMQNPSYKGGWEMHVLVSQSIV